MMWLGGIFTLVIFLIIFLAAGSSSFEEEQEPFVKQFIADFSIRWEPEDVYSRLSNELIENINTVEGKVFLAQFSALGKFKKISDFQIGNYKSSTDGEMADFSFKAFFDKGNALIEITIHSTDDGVRVNYLSITPSTPLVEQEVKEQNA